MDNVAFLEYLFMFDTTNTFSHLYEFENLMASALKDAGMTVEIVNPVDTKSSRRIMMIKKIENNGQVATAPETTSVKSIKQIKNELTRKQGFDGKFVKNG
jgi:hypothetical protein